MISRSIALAALLVAAASVAQAATLQFQDLTAAGPGTTGRTINVGDTLPTGGVDFTGEVFFFSDGTAFSGGFAEIQAASSTTGIRATPNNNGSFLLINNINVAFDIRPSSSLSLDFGEYGGNVNLTVNGDLANVGNFGALDGTTLGGVSISAFGDGATGQGTGSLLLSGPINSFSIGGQEFAIDNVNFAPVPLPASALLLVGGLLAFGAVRRRT